MSLFRCFIMGLLFGLSAFTAIAQKEVDTTTPPYKLYPTLPAFNILMMDSSKVFNTYNIQEGRYSMLIFFSPDCEHCQMLTDSLVNHMDVLKNVQICMFSIANLRQIQEFIDKKQLRKYKNIMVGKDYEIFFPRFYRLSYVPGIAIYDKQKKLAKFYEGDAKMPDLLSQFK